MDTLPFVPASVERLGLAQSGIVDAHCHGFDPEREQGGLDRQFSLSEVAPADGMIEGTVLYRGFARALARLLDCGTERAELTRVRNARYLSAPMSYVSMLYDNAGIELLLVDTGFPSERAVGYEVPMQSFAELVQRPAIEIYRVERILDPLIDAAADFEDATTQFTDAISDAVDRGAVGLKTTIAYRTGLSIASVERSSARRAHARLRKGRFSAVDVKVIRDWWFSETVRAARRHDTPLQIHVGMGDGPLFDMSTARPSLLKVLSNPEFQEARIVLTHAGYPWVEEAGWLANQFDNIYVDISEMNPFAAHGVRTKLLALMEMCPSQKILFGSDGVNAPEVGWFGAVVGRGAVAESLMELVRRGWLTEEDAHEIGTGILGRNARRLYRLADETPSSGRQRQEEEPV